MTVLATVIMYLNLIVKQLSKIKGVLLKLSNVVPFLFRSETL